MSENDLTPEDLVIVSEALNLPADKSGIDDIVKEIKRLMAIASDPGEAVA